MDADLTNNESRLNRSCLNATPLSARRCPRCEKQHSSPVSLFCRCWQAVLYRTLSLRSWAITIPAAATRVPTRSITTINKSRHPKVTDLGTRDAAIRFAIRTARQGSSSSKPGAGAQLLIGDRERTASEEYLPSQRTKGRYCERGETEFGEPGMLDRREATPHERSSKKAFAKWRAFVTR